MSAQIDPSICPVCGEPNQCAIEVAKSTGKPLQECWCASAVFTAEILFKVPAQAINKACICKKCAASS
jgi:hypothetical protein